MNEIKFTFSDLIAGYVFSMDKKTDTYVLKTHDGRNFSVKLRDNTYGWIVNNLNEERHWCSRDEMYSLLVPGNYLYTYGIFYPEQDQHTFEAQYLVFPGYKEWSYVFEQSDWWINQIKALGDFYLEAQFGNGAINYEQYRTTITLSGDKPEDHYRQETDTISRLVYGFSSAYMLTGEDKFLEAAETGTEYLREHMRFYDRDEDVIYWYHGIDIHGNREEKVFASEFGDDYYAIPAYEQIYALTGPVQTYRITGDSRILYDAEKTVDLFERFYLEAELGGYFSHLDPITLDPRAGSLGTNKGEKNWNSVGDHAPAYLINLYLATDEQRYADMLESTFDTIVKHFPDYENSPFVQEKFHEDWSHDTSHLWQQNRGVIGHNLKIAWNLMRMYGLLTKSKYEYLARKIAEKMPKFGMDNQRGGWYDVMERLLRRDEKLHRFAFHDRKAWWQQEQGILAYLIMNGVLGDKQYLRLARESAAFYNAFFLDHDDGAVYFNVLANGIPYLMGTERFKGSHSMSGYHAFELCFLATIYTNLLIKEQPVDLYFKPRPDGFMRDDSRLLRVSPDILPTNTIRIADVWIDDAPYSDFDAEGLTVQLPITKNTIRVKVRVVPNTRRLNTDKHLFELLR
jgi:mannose/cellobiose epimerase-like protein (N-acyl-D-glucosamine 2-epimerase family)